MGPVMWWEYVQRVSGGATNTAIAELIGVTPSSVARWKDSRPDPARARDFAIAFDRPVLEAFIEAGFLTAEEAGQLPAAEPDLAELPDDALLDELRRRLRGAQRDGRGGPDGRDGDGRRKRGGITGHGRAPSRKDG